MKRKHNKHLVLRMISLMLFTASFAVAQNKTISGNVTDVSGIPLIGVNVIEKQTTNGTVTDLDGNYSISVTDGTTILFSYIGFQQQEIQLDGQSEINVVLHEDSELLGELVVIGYGTQRKVNLSGAVDQVGVKELEAKPINNISQGL